MDLNDELLQKVFDALDSEQKGNITVEQFTSALEHFYALYTSNHDNNCRRPSLDVNSIVKVLDPENDGIITFADFKTAFRNFFTDTDESDKCKVTLTLRGRSISIDPGEYLLEDTDEGESEMKMEEIGSSEREGFHKRHIKSNSRTEGSFSPHDGRDSPFSGSRSELMMDDYGSIRNQMRKMEERVDSMSALHTNTQESASQKLRDQNARLHATVAILEERLKEAESRHERDLDGERTHLESLLNRSKRLYEAEIDALRSRIRHLETELAENSVALNKIQLEFTASKLNYTKNSESLREAHETITILKGELKSISSNESSRLKKIMEERDNALLALKEVEQAMNLKSHSEQPGHESILRIQELQQMTRRLKEENNDLKIRLQDANEELLARSVTDGRLLLSRTNRSHGAELDNLTKEEVVDLLTQERNANNQLRHYINNLLEKVVSKHPEILEMKQ